MPCEIAKFNSNFVKIDTKRLVIIAATEIDSKLFCKILFLIKYMNDILLTSCASKMFNCIDKVCFFGINYVTLIQMDKSTCKHGFKSKLVVIYENMICETRNSKVIAIVMFWSEKNLINHDYQVAHTISFFA